MFKHFKEKNKVHSLISTEAFYIEDLFFQFSKEFPYVSTRTFYRFYFKISLPYPKHTPSPTVFVILLAMGSIEDVTTDELLNGIDIPWCEYLFWHSMLLNDFSYKINEHVYWPKWFRSSQKMSRSNANIHFEWLHKAKTESFFQFNNESNLIDENRSGVTNPNLYRQHHILSKIWTN